MANAPMTVVETTEFLRKVKPLLSESERAELVAFIAANPEAGEIIQETGGARVIYYYHSERLPVFLLSDTRRAGRKT